MGANVESVDGKPQWSDVSQGANGLNHLVIADGDQNLGNKETRKSLNFKSIVMFYVFFKKSFNYCLANKFYTARMKIKPQLVKILNV